MPVIKNKTDHLLDWLNSLPKGEPNGPVAVAKELAWLRLEGGVIHPQLSRYVGYRGEEPVLELGPPSGLLWFDNYAGAATGPRLAGLIKHKWGPLTGPNRICLAFTLPNDEFKGYFQLDFLFVAQQALYHLAVTSSGRVSTTGHFTRTRAEVDPEKIQILSKRKNMGNQKQTFEVRPATADEFPTDRWMQFFPLLMRYLRFLRGIPEIGTKPGR